MTDTVQVPREATSEMMQAGIEPFLTVNTKDTSLNGHVARIYAAMVAAAPQATDPRDGEISDLRAYALELQRALTGLTSGGSEFFVRHGEDFRADIRACVARVNEIRASAHDRLLEAVRERKAAEARIATLTAERGSLKELLDECHAKKRLQYERMDEVCEALTAERDALLARIVAISGLISVQQNVSSPLHSALTFIEINNLCALTTTPSKTEARG